VKQRMTRDGRGIWGRCVKKEKRVSCFMKMWC